MISGGIRKDTEMKNEKPLLKRAHIKIAVRSMYARLHALRFVQMIICVCEKRERIYA